MKNVMYGEAPRLCDGGVVVCLATGPSLDPADVDYVRGKARVIAINDAWKLAPWADCLYSSDGTWYPHHQWAPEFPGLKIAMDPTKHKSILTLKRTGDTGVEWDRHGLRSTKNSGGAAINLAVHLGATRVLLLGYDMGATGETHFFGKHPQGLRNSQRTHYQMFRRLIATMAEPLTARGITVLNCTKTSALTCFPKADLRTALS